MLNNFSFVRGTDVPPTTPSYQTKTTDDKNGDILHRQTPDWQIWNYLIGYGPSDIKAIVAVQSGLHKALD